MALLPVSVASSCPETDCGHNLFAVVDEFRMDIEQIREGLTVFGVAPWKNGFLKHEYDDSSFFDEDQTDVCGWDL